jgi:hypothetical protein
MRKLTETWQDASVLFDDLIGLHDATIYAIRFTPNERQCTLVLSEVQKFSEATGFQTAHNTLLAKMHGANLVDSQKAEELVGYDVVKAELLPDSLWISTLAGSLLIRFEKISFELPNGD